MMDWWSLAPWADLNVGCWGFPTTPGPLQGLEQDVFPEYDLESGMEFVRETGFFSLLDLSLLGSGLLFLLFVELPLGGLLWLTMWMLLGVGMLSFFPGALGLVVAEAGPGFMVPFLFFMSNLLVSLYLISVD